MDYNWFLHRFLCSGSTKVGCDCDYFILITCLSHQVELVSLAPSKFWREIRARTTEQPRKIILYVKRHVSRKEIHTSQIYFDPDVKGESRDNRNFTLSLISFLNIKYFSGMRILFKFLWKFLFQNTFVNVFIVESIISVLQIGSWNRPV